MARPKGYRLSKSGLAIWKRSEDIKSLTETAAILGLNLPTLSNLITGVSGASEKTVRSIEARIGQDATGAIFPESTGRFAALPDAVEAA